MATFTQSLMELVTPDLISKASSLLGENEAKVEVATKSTFASMLGGLLNKGSDSTLESLFLNASNSDLLSNVGNLFNGALDEKFKNMGGEFISSLFGDKVADVVNLITAQSGLSQENTTKLMSMLSPLMAGFMGNKLKSGMGLGSLLSSIAGDRSQFLNFMPKELSHVLGVSNLADLGANLVQDIPKSMASIAPEMKKSFPWLKVVVPAGLALLGFYFMMGRDKASNQTQAIHNGTENIVKVAKTDVESTLNQPRDNAERLSAQIGDKIDGVANVSLQQLRDMIDIVLPDGSILQGLKFGTEARMLEFLQSDDYVLMTNDELKKYWFDFDNINFEFGSGTAITKESEVQIKNIALLLSNFNDSLVKIGAYTDRKGDEALNMKLSETRANTIKQLLIEAGVPESRIIGAEGYGAQFATVSADASDDARAKDRRVAIRFEREE